MRRCFATEFKKLELADMEKIRPYFNGDSGINDNTPGTVMMWRNFSGTEFLIRNNTLLRKMRYFNGEAVFAMPFGEDREGALLWLREYCETRGIPFSVGFVTEKDAALLQSLFKTEVQEEENWGDYVYQLSDLAEMTGKKYNTQRNHMNAFRRAFPEYTTQPLCDKNFEEVKQFFSHYNSEKSKDSPYFLAEQKMVYEVLEHFDLYGMTGLCLYAGEILVGFTAGEIMGDTLFVHIEKADAAVRGAYPMLVQEFAKINAGKAVLINREEDMGDEGLRKSKLAYRPLKIIAKYTVHIV